LTLSYRLMILSIVTHGFQGPTRLRGYPRGSTASSLRSARRLAQLIEGRAVAGCGPMDYGDNCDAMAYMETSSVQPLVFTRAGGLVSSSFHPNTDDPDP
jgi:hypothetical protein